MITTVSLMNTPHIVKIFVCGKNFQNLLLFLLLLFFFCFLGPHPLHMEVPKLGVESEL